MAKILVVAGHTDAEAGRVAEEMKGRAVSFSLLDTASFPQKVRLLNRGGSLSVSHRKIDMPCVVYVRGLASHPLMPSLHEELLKRPRGLIAQCEEKRAFLESILLMFQEQGATLVNSLEANRQHGCKPYQLRLLQDAGLPVPKWIATNDPKDVRGFVKQVGRCIYKPLAGGATVRMVEKADLSSERLSSLDLAPVLFQEYVEGVSVRAFVVGRRVVATAEIRSSEIDYRRDEESVEPTKLSLEERRAALAAARACGMTFTGVDLIRGCKGFHVLECNPSPMFAVFERKTGLDVGGALAELLCGIATRPR